LNTSELAFLLQTPGAIELYWTAIRLTLLAVASPERSTAGNTGATPAPAPAPNPAQVTGMKSSLPQSGIVTSSEFSSSPSPLGRALRLILSIANDYTGMTVGEGYSGFLRNSKEKEKKKGKGKKAGDKKPSDGENQDGNQAENLDGVGGFVVTAKMLSEASQALQNKVMVRYIIHNSNF
jgi:hypothetical protein